ncbi:MAG TPA: ribonuclease HII [Paracoccaceae bacterium]|nr:ribonuclease HII [Paracoccaceae bacterium]
MLPDWTIEDECAADSPGPICGIDEAGRGPWAGPVVAAAVILDRIALPDGIDDSKRLNATARARLFDEIMASAQVGVGIGSVMEIERLNIVHANDLAMARALGALGRLPAIALVDGKWKPKTIAIPVRTVIGGDALSLSIAAASIIAKVTRDRIMHRLDRECPGYGWRTNVGYGTREHRDALTRLGPTCHHRRLWAPVAKILETMSEAKESHQDSLITN